MELFAELPDHFTFRPGETLIILAHHQDAVLVPTLTLDVVGRAPLSAVSFGCPPHGNTKVLIYCNPLDLFNEIL